MASPGVCTFYHCSVVGKSSCLVCILLPFEALQSLCAALSSPSSAPPLDRGITWSAVHDLGCVAGSVTSIVPVHMWHVWDSRLSRSRARLYAL